MGPFQGRDQYDVSGLKDGMESLGDGMKKVAEEVASVREKMKDGFVEVQDGTGFDDKILVCGFGEEI